MSECPGRPSSWILLYIDQIFSQLADAIKHLTSTACHSHGLRYISESEKRWLFFLTTTTIVANKRALLRCSAALRFDSTGGGNWITIDCPIWQGFELCRAKVLALTRKRYQ